jgi:hypothetical protein
MKDSHAVLIEELTRLRAERNAPTRREADLERALRWALRELRPSKDDQEYHDACALVGIDASTGKAVK